MKRIAIAIEHLAGGGAEKVMLTLAQELVKLGHEVHFLVLKDNADYLVPSNIGVHVCTVPWKVMKQFTSNHFTEVGISQFVEHTKLMTVTVKAVLSNKKATVSQNATITDALVQMTATGFGCVAVLDDTEKLVGTFTDGDLRRLIENEGEHAVTKNLGDLSFNPPITIQGEELLHKASEIFREKGVDNLIVLHDDEVVSQIDIQDLT